jgi:hypothetical protein
MLLPPTVDSSPPSAATGNSSNSSTPTLRCRTKPLLQPGGKVRPHDTTLRVDAGLAQIPFKIRLGGSIALFLPAKEKGWGKKGERKGRGRKRMT